MHLQLPYLSVCLDPIPEEHAGTNGMNPLLCSPTRTILIRKISTFLPSLVNFFNHPKPMKFVGSGSFAQYGSIWPGTLTLLFLSCNQKCGCADGPEVVSPFRQEKRTDWCPGKAPERFLLIQDPHTPVGVGQGGCYKSGSLRLSRLAPVDRGRFAEAVSPTPCAEGPEGWTEREIILPQIPRKRKKAREVATATATIAAPEEMFAA